MWGRPTQRQCLQWQNFLVKPSKLLVDPGKNLNFDGKRDVWCCIVFFNIKNKFVIVGVPRRWVQVLDKSPIMTSIESARIVNSGN